DDLLEGGVGDDRLLGGDGFNRLLGGAGNDTLIGTNSLQGELFVGGAGADRIELNTGIANDRIIIDQISTEMDGDVIANFGLQTTVLFSEPEFDHPFSFIIQGDFTGTAGEVRILYEGDDIIVSVDMDGDASGDATLTINDPAYKLYGAAPPLRIGGLDGGFTISIDGNADVIRLGGTDGDDVLSGTPGPDLIDGKGGNDKLDGGDGNDLLMGLEGDDVLFGGDGDDELVGGDGNDTLDGGFGTNAFDAGPGDDLIIASGAADDIDGGLGVDTVEILDSEAFDINDAVFAPNPQSGLVLASLTTGSVFTLSNVEQVLRINPVTTQAEETLLLGTTGDDDVDASAGDRDTTIFAGDGDDMLIGSAFSDLLVGGAGDSVLDGGLGDDVLVADLNGTQALDGGTGDDTVVLENFAETSDPLTVTLTDISATSAAGAATYQNTETVIIAGPTDGDDTVDASATTTALNSVVLLGDAGDDTLIGGAAQTVLWGGAGQDTLTAGTGQTAFFFESITDEVDGDQLFGFKPGDTLIFFQVEALAQPAALEISFIADGAFTGTAGEVRYQFDAGNTLVAFDLDGDAAADTTLTLTGQTLELTFDFNTVLPFTGLALTVVEDLTLTGTSGDDVLDGGDGDDTISGLGGADQIAGGFGDDTLDGGPGNDLIRGGDGNDSLTGGPGADSLDGASGNDTIDGGTGTDEISGGPGDDILNGGDDDDLIQGETGNDTLRGGAGDDVLGGGLGTNTVNGGAGNDTIDIGDPFAFGVTIDTIDGGTGFDTLRFASDRSVFFDLTAPTADTGTFSFVDDTALFDITFENIERLQRLDPADLTTLNQLVLFGGDSGDTIDASSEALRVTIAGLDGDDTITGSAFGDILQGAAGNDTLAGNDGDDTFIETLTGTNTIDGGAGFDRVQIDAFGASPTTPLSITVNNLEIRSATTGGRTSITAIEGVTLASTGAGDDTLDAAAASIEVALDGGAGNDTLTGGSGTNFLRGGAGADTIIGGSGPNQIEIIDAALEMDGDTVSGLNTGDTLTILSPDIDAGQLYFFLGEAAFTGRAGEMRIVRSASETRLDADLDGDGQADHALRFTDGDVQVSLGFEDVEGFSLTVDAVTPPPGGDPGPTPDPGPDPIPDPGPDPTPDPTPDPGPPTAGDRIEGDDTADTLRGTGGDDVLLGRGGDDDLRGSSGDDTVNGEAGDDFLAGGTGADTLLGGFGDDTLNGGAQDDRLDGGAGEDRLLGGGGNDILEGGDDDDLIQGGRGADTIDGGRGNDTVLAGADDDFINGGFGDDFLAGASGNDTIDGDGGDDTINGALGDDVLSGGFGNDVLNGGAGRDILSGDNGADIVRGQGGTDLVSGGAGNDQLFGGGGDDLLFGDAGIDTVFAGGGADTVVLADGTDTVRGQSGLDTFIIDGAGVGNHTIVDFDQGEFVRLENFDFSNLQSAEETFQQSGTDVVFQIGEMVVTFTGATLADVVENLAVESASPPPSDAGPGTVSLARAADLPGDEADTVFVFEADDFTEIA
ncbi:MAG: hypothetical protein AAF253_07060, partial [Pseudomonadota bacterium]